VRRTSRAISSNGAAAFFMRAMAWTNSCCECACEWSMSSGSSASSMRFRPALSGRWRKNSCQKPSESSRSSSSSCFVPLQSSLPCYGGPGGLMKRTLNSVS
jgi:hypothetical protein